MFGDLIPLWKMMNKRKGFTIPIYFQVCVELKGYVIYVLEWHMLVGTINPL